MFALTGQFGILRSYLLLWAHLEGYKRSLRVTRKCSFVIVGERHPGQSVEQFESSLAMTRVK